MGVSAKRRLVPDLQTARVCSLTPAEVNGAIYRPVTPDDPDVIRLAESIAEHGVLTPITITTDDVILSGHRRHCAAVVAGLERVPVIRSRISSHDPGFIKQLVASNESRSKTLAEVLRETVVCDASPEEAHQELVTYRQKRSQANVPSASCIDAGDMKQRAKISRGRWPFLEAVLGVINEMREFWPLSERTIHYQLLNDPPMQWTSTSKRATKESRPYRNDGKSYSNLSKLITQARFEGLIPFEAVHDPTRPVTQWRASQNAAAFLRDQTEDYLRGYFRDLMQSQPRHVEVLGEKNTLQSIVKPVCAEYTIPLTIGRGYCSVPPRKAIYDRYMASGKEGLTLIVLSDHDPDGEQIAESFVRSMRDDFGVPSREITAVRAALSHAQVAELGLPCGLERAKPGSSGYKRFVNNYGHHVYELEAVPPRRLQDMLRAAINEVIDVELFREEEVRERADAAELHATRQRIIAAIQSGADGVN